MTYNYRGIGPSARRAENQRLTMRDWLSQDVPAVTAWAASHMPEAPILAVGHSLGGHAFGIGGSSAALSGGVLIASHAGALRLVRGLAERMRIGMVFRSVVPVIGRLTARFPGKRLGIGEDIPSAAMRDWGRWILMRNYFFDDPSLDAARQFAEVTIPLRAYGFDDDPWATPAAIDLLCRQFTATRPERRQIDPAANGTGPVGHMGFFRDRNRDGLWTEVATWLGQQADAARPKTADKRMAQSRG